MFASVLSTGEVGNYGELLCRKLLNVSGSAVAFTDCLVISGIIHVSSGLVVAAGGFLSWCFMLKPF